MRFYLLIELVRLIQPFLGQSHTQVYEVLIAPNVENEYVVTTYNSSPRVFLETRIWRKHSSPPN